VSYRSDQLRFEPLEELFNGLESNRVRRGLFQRYVEHEELKGEASGDTLEVQAVAAAE